ncbi:MAG: hypothetical protein GX844_07010 [Alcaligenaceae bacterium]|nr:hypothetical protein [Alcaligenaceae bacterium]
MSSDVKNGIKVVFQWLVKFLRNRGITKPDGRSLYKYQITYEEYQSLKIILISYLSQKHPIQNRDFSACFVLFCAEWYRREYKPEYGWSWDAIWRELGAHVEANIRADMIVSGLKGYWQREISTYESDRRNLLGSVFIEGGLPFQCLQGKDSKFQDFFVKVLKLHKRYRNIGYSIKKLVTDVAQQIGLPQAFQVEASQSFLAHMTDELVSLIDLYELSDKKNPADELDKLKPNWREGFPIPLDTQIGRDFINSLLISASTEVKISTLSPGVLKCRHFYYKNTPEYLHTSLSLPKDIYFEKHKHTVSSRLELAVFEGDTLLLSLGPCYTHFSEQGLRIRNNVYDAIVKRQTPQRDLRLCLLFHGAEIASQTIPNSFIDVGSVPLGFVPNEDGDYALVGQATFTIKAETLRLWVPLKAEIIVEKGMYMPSNLIIHQCSVLDIQEETLLRIRNEEDFKISLNSHAHIVNNIVLTGKELAWPTKPSTVYLGFPRPSIQESLREEDTGSLDLKLIISGQKYESASHFQNYGVHHVVVRSENGVALFRRKVGILPADFHLELESGNTPNEGIVWIQTEQEGHYEIIESSIENYFVYDENYPNYIGVHMAVRAPEQPPSSFQLSIQYGVADPVILTLPFPASGFLAFNAEGSKLPRELSINELLGARLYLFGRLGSSSTRYELDLSLKGGERLNIHEHWSVLVEQQPVEISLFMLKDQIEHFLSLQRGIDRYVELTVNNQLVCRISRYAVDLTLDKNRWLVSFVDKDYVRTNYPKPSLISLTSPEKRPIVLTPYTSQGVEIGEYALPLDLDLDLDKIWLIVPTEDSQVSFRPELLCLENKESNGTEADLDTVKNNIRWAARYFDPAVRPTTFDSVITKMSQQAGHKGWHYIKTIYENYGYLPLATFEAWLALMQNQRAIAMALFKFEMNEILIRRLASRFPFAWELFPIRQFLYAEQDFFDYLQIEGLPVEMLPKLKEKLYNRLSDAVPIYSGDVLTWLKFQRIDKKTRAARQFIDQIMPSWYQSLLTQRSDEESWPSFAGFELKKWVKTQENIYFIDTEIDYRNLVVYLPIFAAAVAAEKVDPNLIFNSDSELIFYLRQVRDFDTDWFNAVYQYALLSYLEV